MTMVLLKVCPVDTVSYMKGFEFVLLSFILITVYNIGFASFCYIIGFFLLLSAAVYVSPLICGSNNEKKMVQNPQEIDTGYSYAEKPSAPPV